MTADSEPTKKTPKERYRVLPSLCSWYDFRPEYRPVVVDRSIPIHCFVVERYSQKFGGWQVATGPTQWQDAAESWKDRLERLGIPNAFFPDRLLSVIE